MKKMPVASDRKKMRVFVLGLPHTLTLDSTKTPFLTCAFTNKVWTLCKMLAGRGHEVVHLGVEGSSPVCTEQVDVVPAAEWKKLYGQKKPNEFYDIAEDGDKQPYMDLFASNARREILKRCGPDFTSIICVTWGGCQWRAVNGISQFVVESGIGYPNASAQYRVYESYAWMNFHLGKANMAGGGAWYWSVIPLAVDPTLFGPVTEKKDNYALYLGRIIDGKGVDVACQVARHLKIPLKIVGQGDPGPFLGPGVTYQGPVGAEERRQLLRKARVLFAPTKYVEPFGGVAVDAAMSGCPTITTDWGAFPETVLHGETGYRCRTLEQFIWAARNIDRIRPATCRAWAEKNYGLGRIALMYEEFFRSVLDVKKDEDHDGWLTLRPDRRELDWLRRVYPLRRGK